MNRASAVSFFRGVALVGVYGGLFMPAMFIPVVIFPFVFSKLIFFQVLIGLTFPAYIALAWMEPKYRPRFHWLYAAIGAYLVAIALSVLFAADPLRAWWGNQERMNGLFTLLHFFVWLSMAVGVLRTWVNWRRLLNYQVGVALLMSFSALLQKIFPNILLFPAGPRVGGLLDNPIYMGAYQIFNLFFLGLLFLKTHSTPARVTYGVFAIFGLMAFLAGQSRGALIGLAVGILVFGCYYALFTKSRKVRFSVLGVVGCLFVAYGLLFAFRDSAFIKGTEFERLTSFSSSITTRFIAWNISWQGFLERPLFGWGFDNYHLLFNSHYNPQSLRYGVYETWFDRSHNTVLDVLAMTGLVGFITFAATFILLFWSVWRAHRKGWVDLPIAAIFVALPCAYFVQNLFVFDHPAGFSMSYLMFAIIIAATRGEFLEYAPAESGVVNGRTRTTPWILFGILQFFALLLVYRVSYLPFRASMFSIRANSLFGTAQAHADVVAASKIWTPYLDEQTFLLSRNLITAATQGSLDRVVKWQELYTIVKQTTQEELHRHGKNTHPNLTYAQLLAAMNRFVPADVSLTELQFQKAIDTSPKRQQIHYNLASFYLSQNRIDDAVTVYRRVRDFDPGFGEGYWMYGSLLLSIDSSSREGLENLLRAREVERPYNFREVRELSQMAEVYRIMNRLDDMKKILDRLPDLQSSGTDVYARLAFQYERVGLSAERDRILLFASMTDPSVRQLYENYVAGAAK